LNSLPDKLPSALEVIAGPFRDAIAKIWKDHDLGEYLSADSARRHVWHACLSSVYSNFDPESCDAAFIYERFKTWKGKNLIVQAFGCKPRGFIQVLGRLGPLPRSPEIYRSLLSIMELEGCAAKLLMHSKHPSDTIIVTLERLPKTIGWKTLRALYPLFDDVPEDLALFLWNIERAELLWPQFDKMKILRSPKPIAAFRRFLETLDFPEPPWRGTDILRPIRSGTELAAVAVKFANCLADRYDNFELYSILNNTSYFYEWHGNENALIELIRFNAVGWFARTALGIANQSLSQRTLSDIVAEFEEVDCICALRLTMRSPIYPSSWFWNEIARGAH
jgi:hypothetical protein